MAHLLVGDKDCSFDEIALIFDEPSISTLKITWWTNLAMHLGIPLDSVIIWDNDLKRDKSHIVVIQELLAKWRAKEGNNATIGALHKLIPNEQKQLKDFIQAKIREKAKCWNDLDADSKNAVLDVRQAQ